MFGIILMLDLFRRKVVGMDYLRQAELNKELSKIVDNIVQGYNPLEIILYGSLADGNNIHEFSDIDLVVIKDTEKSFYERLEEIVDIAQPDLAADILVYTPEEKIQAMKDNLFFQEEIVKKGKVLFSVKQ